MRARSSKGLALRVASLVGVGALTLVGSAPAAHADATSPLASYNANGTYADGTGNHPPATPSGGVTFGPGFSGSPGDQSFQLDGTGAVTTDGGVGSFGTGTFDVSFSLKTTQSGVVELLSKRATCGYGTFIDIRLSDGQLIGEVDGAGPADYTLVTDGVVNTGQWYQVTLRRTATKLQFLLNGNIANQVSITGNPNLTSTTPVRFADGPCVGVDGTRKLVGNLDNVSFSMNPGPPPLVPEVPAALLLPGTTGALLVGGFLVLRRRRPALAAT